jgi:hypothetical protein
VIGYSLLDCVVVLMKGLFGRGPTRNVSLPFDACNLQQQSVFLWHCSCQAKRLLAKLTPILKIQLNVKAAIRLTDCKGKNGNKTATSYKGSKNMLELPR